MTARMTAVILLIAFCWALHVWPTVDLQAASLFYSVDSGKFLLQSNRATILFLDALQFLGLLFPLAVTAAALCVRSFPALMRNFPRPSTVAYLLAVSVLVPGLGVNLLKETFGRARPVHIVQFGGTAEFAPALVVSNQCAANCSFVSGDASEAFVPLAIAMLAKRRRKWYTGLALGLGVTVAAMKVMQGRHFLSDVIVAAALTVIINYEIYLIYLRRKGPTEPADQFAGQSIIGP